MMKPIVLTFAFVGLFFTHCPVWADHRFGDIDLAAKTVRIAYAKCNKENAIQLVGVDRKNERIQWRWDEKPASWCGWGLEAPQLRDISHHLNDDLVIEFIGSFKARSPEVKFIDIDHNYTPLLSFSLNLSGNPKIKAVVRLPVKRFFGNDTNFYPADPKNIIFLQFDAEFNSTSGKISIIRIGFEPHKVN